MPRQILIELPHGRVPVGDATRALALQRWADGILCPRCELTGCAQAEPVDLSGRRRAYRCSRCGTRVSPAHGTLFAGARQSLSRWFAAMSLVAHAPHCSPRTLKVALGVTSRTAARWHDTLRRALVTRGTGTLVGVVDLAVDTVQVWSREGQRRHVSVLIAVERSVVFGARDLVWSRSGECRFAVLENDSIPRRVAGTQGLAQEGSTVRLDDDDGGDDDLTTSARAWAAALRGAGYFPILVPGVRRRKLHRPVGDYAWGEILPRGDRAGTGARAGTDNEDGDHEHRNGDKPHATPRIGTGPQRVRHPGRRRGRPRSPRVGALLIPPGVQAHDLFFRFTRWHAGVHKTRLHFDHLGECLAAFADRVNVAERAQRPSVAFLVSTPSLGASPGARVPPVRRRHPEWISFRLTARQRRYLQRVHEYGGSESTDTATRRRAAAVLWAAERVPIRAIAACFLCEPKTVREWVRRFREAGTVEARPRPGRPRHRQADRLPG